MPKMKVSIVFTFSGYFRDSGNNCINDICDIIPATIANVYPIITSVIMGFKNKNAISAPNGSANADIKVNFKAFLLLPVALYTGTDMLIPSGILWSAIAKVNDIPSDILVLDDKKVAIPSGILWIIIAIIENIPNL